MSTKDNRKELWQIVIKVGVRKPDWKNNSKTEETLAEHVHMMEVKHKRSGISKATGIEKVVLPPEPYHRSQTYHIFVHWHILVWTEPTRTSNDIFKE